MTVFSKYALLFRIFLIAGVFAFSSVYALAISLGGGQENTQSEGPKIVRATEQQTDLIRTCVIAANRARSNAGTTGRSASDPHFETFADYQMGLVEKELKTFTAGHEDFTDSLTDEQKERITADLEAVDKLVKAVDSNMGELRRLLKKEKLEEESISRNALAIESMMKECQQIYKNIAATLRVKLERGR